MPQKKWTSGVNGNNGAEIQTIINDNFTELYNSVDVHVDNFETIESALEYAQSNNKANVVFSPKDYYSTALLDISGLNIIGNGARLFREYMPDKERIFASGSCGDYYDLIQDGNKGDSWLYVSQDLIDEIETGSIVKILTDEICQPEAGENVRFGEMHKVQSIDDDLNLIYFQDYLFTDYTIAQNSRVCKVTTTKGSIKDLSIIFPTDTDLDEVGVTVSYAEDYIIDIKVENACQYSIKVNDCYRPIINAKTFNGTLTGYGYGVALGGATMYARVTGIFIGHRHCFTTTGSSATDLTYGGVSWGTIVYNSQGTSGLESSVIFDTHASTGSITFQNCSSYGGIHRDWIDVQKWDTLIAYTEGEYVLQNGRMYICEFDNTGIDPETDYEDSYWEYKARNGTAGFGTEGLNVYIKDCESFECANGISLSGRGGDTVHINGFYAKNAIRAIYGVEEISRKHLTIRNIVHDNDFHLVDAYTIYMLGDSEDMLIENIKSRNAKTAIFSLNEYMPDELIINNIECKRDHSVDDETDMSIEVRTPIFKKIIVNNATIINLGVFMMLANIEMADTEYIIFNNTSNFGKLYDSFKILHPYKEFVTPNFINDDE